ncbi:hypothetical protein [Achromobacter xylosoxidans]|uniref:Uncharacterized protein n=1 Tax=Alcaligenes xylosoxydans xylosoxydans TaxID=85698 RepID=A0A1R1JSE8_ALCXX|nr:hypothetical protein [Achromobacter xylosoxidans]OMG85399.1 hypothetical protein BIZ92_27010 [Achromobacter xylosoxidans]
MAKKQQPANEPQDQTQDQPADPVVPPPADSNPAEPLGVFIARHEDAAMALGIVVTMIIHPNADEGVHAGRYGGIRLGAGEALATYSDGTKHQ